MAKTFKESLDYFPFFILYENGILMACFFKEEKFEKVRKMF